MWKDWRAGEEGRAEVGAGKEARAGAGAGLGTGARVGAGAGVGCICVCSEDELLAEVESLVSFLSLSGQLLVGKRETEGRK